MLVNTLTASRPICKTVVLDASGDYSTHPYPFIKNFTSQEHQVESSRDFYALIVETANRGGTVLKGQLKQPLDNQSRAGMTDSMALANWICLDIDADKSLGTSPDELLSTLHPALGSTSYVLQHSARDGITVKEGTRYHIFMLLAQPIQPALLKQWLIKINLETQVLRDNLQLSANGCALKYPLDISVCQNDKLLYVAPPICMGFEDPLQGHRIVHVVKDQDKANLSSMTVNAERNQQAIDTIINELREKAGLEKKKRKLKQVGHANLLLNPDQAVVTGTQDARGFIYLNLNNGDSWGYYHSKDNPHILYNFKGEPPVYLRDIVPDYYQTLMDTRAEDHAEQPIVFREPQSDSYFNGVYYPKTNRVKLAQVASKDKIKDFLAQYGLLPPEHIEDYTYEFNPQTNIVYSPEKKWVNRFTPTPYMLDDTTPSSRVPTTIEKIIRSICVDELTYEHFINWLAVIFQKRVKTGTAWIFHGVPGTGKGLLHEKIIQPLLGRDHTPKIVTQQLEEQFNGYVETSLITWVDEIKLSGANNDKIVNKLKHMITEETTTIRNLYRSAVKITCYDNVILATNHKDPMPIAPNDRRMNVAPAQETPINVSQLEIDFIEDELPFFAAYLRDYPINMQQSRTILKNEARDLMIRAARNSVDTLFDAIRLGDFDFLFEFITDSPKLSFNNLYIDYERTIKRLAAHIEEGEIVVTRDDLMSIYMYLNNKPNTTATAFTRLCSMQDINLKKTRVGDKIVMATTIRFSADQAEDIKRWATADNVVHMQSLTG